VLEVHPPNEPVRGWHDFFVHLATITIGLLIALSLEGCVEFWQHRHLVHEAEASMQIEIESNARELKGALEDVRKEQEFLKNDIAVMKKIIANPKVPNTEDMRVDFRIRTFGDVSWKTAQSTGALSYMPYERAQEYSNIYSAQSEIRDAEQAGKIVDRLEVLQGQLIFLESMINSLDDEYKKFLAAHPD
jgi:hypothetical protein